MAQVNFGPIGTYLISVKGKLDADGNIIEGNDYVHFIAYEDVTSGTIFTWVLDSTASITDITDISEAASTNFNRLTNEYKPNLVFSLKNKKVTCRIYHYGLLKDLLRQKTCNQIYKIYQERRKYENSLRHH